MQSTSGPGLSLVDLVRGLSLCYALITVRHPESGQVIQFEQHQEMLASCSAIVLQPICFQGIQIGLLELHTNSLKPGALLRAAQALHDQILQALDLNAQESALAA